MLSVSDDFNKAGATLAGLNASRSAVGVAVQQSSGRLKNTLKSTPATSSQNDNTVTSAQKLSSDLSQSSRFANAQKAPLCPVPPVEMVT